MTRVDPGLLGELAAADTPLGFEVPGVWGAMIAVPIAVIMLVAA